MIATGGGALVDERNYARAQARGRDRLPGRAARSDRAARRRSTRAAQVARRRQAAGSAIAELMAERRAAYARADFIVDTSDLTVDERRSACSRIFGQHVERPSMRTFRVELGPDAHPVHVGAGLLDQLGELARAAGLKPAGRALILPTPTSRGCMASARPPRSRRRASTPRTHRVAAGEASKSLATLEPLYDRDRRGGTRSRAAPCSRSAAAWSAISPASPRRLTCAASRWCRFRPRWSRRSTRRWAARPPSIIRGRRT